MFNLRRIETIFLPSKAENAYSMDVSQTGHVAICTSAFILIYQIVPNKENTGKGISCRKYVIPLSNYKLGNDLGLDIREFLYELPREQYYESILTVDLTPDLDNVQLYVAKAIKCIWSPPCCDKNYDCVLATLANNGVVEILVKKYDMSYGSEFTRVCNVTQKYIAILKESWQDVNDKECTEKLKELMTRTNEVKVKCFTWSSCTSKDYYILILGHLSGKITFWKVSSQTQSSQLDVDFLSVHQSNLEQMTSLVYKKISDGALLFIGARDGRVHTLNLITSSKGLDIKEEHILQAKKDDLRIRSIHVVNMKFGYFIILVKVTTIIIIPFDKMGETYEFTCDNIEILDLIIIENHILILMKTGVVKEVVLSSAPSGIDIKWRHFYIDINTYMKCPLSMIASRNKTLFFILARHCKPKQSKVHPYNVELQIFGNNATKCLEYLFSTPSKQLTYMWDCLELYRSFALQTKNLLIGKTQFEQHYDNYEIYILKVLLHVSRIYESVSDQLNDIPAIRSFDEVLAVFHLKMAVVRMQYLLELYKKNCNLSTFHRQNLLILSNYIRQIAVEDTAKTLNLSDSMMDIIIEVMQRVKGINFTENDLDRCITCGEKLYDITCMPPHYDTRCAISLMQIKGIVKYKCLLCNSVIHDEVAKEVNVIVCPFCDVPMLERPVNVEIGIKNEILITFNI